MNLRVCLLVNPQKFRLSNHHFSHLQFRPVYQLCILRLNPPRCRHRNRRHCRRCNRLLCLLIFLPFSPRQFHLFSRLVNPLMLLLFSQRQFHPCNRRLCRRHSRVASRLASLRHVPVSNQHQSPHPNLLLNPPVIPLASRRPVHQCNRHLCRRCNLLVSQQILLLYSRHLALRCNRPLSHPGSLLSDP